MPVSARPLSYAWTIKAAVDEIRSITSEYDEQIVSDDSIKAHLQLSIMSLHSTFPRIKDYYLVEIPFVVDTTVYPQTPTTPRAQMFQVAGGVTAARRLTDPIKIFAGPPGIWANNRWNVQQPVRILNPNDPRFGYYDFNYEHPINFEVVEWRDVINSITGTCRRTSDYTQLTGIAKGNNTLLARTAAYYNAGSSLWVVLRENLVGPTRIYNLLEEVPVTEEPILTGIAIRSVIPLIDLQNTNVMTGIPTDYNPNAKAAPQPVTINQDPPQSMLDLNETMRYAPILNDLLFLDCPDQYAYLAIQMAAIKVWGMIGKQPQEQLESSVNANIAQLHMQMESQIQQSDVFKKDNQWKDRGHL